MIDYAFRTVVAASQCAGGEVIYCDDGATFFSFPNGISSRSLVEGTPVPGTLRATECSGTPLQNPAVAWAAVAGNLAQILLDTAHAVEQFSSLHPELASSLGLEAGDLRSAYRGQCEAHGITR